MAVLRHETRTIGSSEDMVAVRQVVREWATAVGFSLVEQTKLVTAASELARNTLIHGGGGHMTMARVEEGVRNGIRLVFEDSGPGIPDMALAMTDGWTSGNGLGLGLTGAKRLASEFDIVTGPGMGTRVTIVRWR